MISIIAAIDNKRGLGRANKLLFRIPEDMKRMKVLTTGHPLVMGRKTFESLGRLLPERTHIVITADEKGLDRLDYKPHFVVSSLEEGIEKAKSCGGAEEIFIFGGGQVYKEAMEKGFTDRLYLTLVEGDYGAETFFPDYSNFKKIIKREESESGGYRYVWLILEK